MAHSCSGWESESGNLPCSCRNADPAWMPFSPECRPRQALGAACRATRAHTSGGWELPAQKVKLES